MGKRLTYRLNRRRGYELRLEIEWILRGRRWAEAAAIGENIVGRHGGVGARGSQRCFAVMRMKKGGGVAASRGRGEQGLVDVTAVRILGPVAIDVAAAVAVAVDVFASELERGLARGLVWRGARTFSTRQARSHLLVCTTALWRGVVVLSTPARVLVNVIGSDHQAEPKRGP